MVDYLFKVKIESKRISGTREVLKYYKQKQQRRFATINPAINVGPAVGRQVLQHIL